MRSGFGSGYLLALAGGDYTKRSFSERRAAPAEALADSGSSSIAFPRRDFDIWKRLVEGAGHGETWELTKLVFLAGDTPFAALSLSSLRSGTPTLQRPFR